MTNIWYAPESWYHDDSQELDELHCHHGNFYEDCEECEIEENPNTEHQEWSMLVSLKTSLKKCTALTQ